MTETLTDLPGIGPVLAGHLRAVGIDSPDDLRAAGTRQVFERIRASRDPGACLNMLTAIEGAVEGVPKRLLSPTVRDELIKYFRTLPDDDEPARQS